jgi:drug/metabolite transporter (DMT)-like permease
MAYLLGEEIGRTTWLALPIGILGLYFMLSPYGEISPGLIYGLASGISYAILFFLIKSVRRVMSSIHITFIILGLASLLISPSLLIFPLGNLNVFWLLGLGLVPTAIAFTLFSYGIKYCRVEQAPLFALIEPVSAAIFGYIAFNEILGGKQLVGAGMILVSIALAWRKVG